jgi:prevent-host-death family protein
MPDITATEAARNFADLLDGVEHDGAHYTIVGRGKAVAHLEPIDRGRGKGIKDLLRRHRPDEAWSEDLVRIRASVEIEERP